jgi:hypothetical protein
MACQKGSPERLVEIARSPSVVDQAHNIRGSHSLGVGQPGTPIAPRAIGIQDVLNKRSGKIPARRDVRNSQYVQVQPTLS